MTYKLYRAIEGEQSQNTDFWFNLNGSRLRCFDGCDEIFAGQISSTWGDVFETFFKDELLSLKSACLNYISVYGQRIPFFLLDASGDLIVLFKYQSQVWRMSVVSLFYTVVQSAIKEKINMLFTNLRAKKDNEYALFYPQIIIRIGANVNV